jgi:hypothetical protein
MPARKFSNKSPTEYLGIQTPAGSGLREVRVAPPLADTPPGPMDFDDLTPSDWDEVKRQVLMLLGSRVLDTPENHLAYIR